ncbi:hypothetical protein LFY75_001851, partial [Campylobacter jejuni]|nr:hypothetical protein [Campylobacter jejuni]
GAIDNLKLEFDKSGKFVSGIDSVTSVDYRFNKVDEFLKDWNDYKS